MKKFLFVLPVALALALLATVAVATTIVPVASANCPARQYVVAIEPGSPVQLGVCDPQSNCLGVDSGTNSYWYWYNGWEPKANQVVGHVPVGATFTVSANGSAVFTITPNCFDGPDFYLHVVGKQIFYPTDLPNWVVAEIKSSGVYVVK